MNKKMSTQTGTNSKLKGKVPFIICGLIIAILIGVITVLILKNKEDNSIKRNVVVNEKNAEKIAKQMVEEDKTPIGSYEVTMNSTWNFENGTAASENAYVENSKRNINPVCFDIIRSDTNEAIYASPILPVGTHLEDITLDKELPAGTYDCVCTYHLLDDKDKPIGKLNISITIVVSN